MWLTAGGFGVWYVITDPEAPSTPEEQETINFTTPPTQTQYPYVLESWSARYFMRDWVHPGNDYTNIIYGSHHSGVWYLKFPDDPSGENYHWNHMSPNFNGTDIRDFNLYYDDSGNTMFLADGFGLGISTKLANSGLNSAWTDLGVDNVPPDTDLDPRFNKGSMAAFYIDGKYYFGGSGASIVVENPFGTPVEVNQGGLFEIDAETNVTTRVDFLPDQSLDETKYSVSDIKGMIIEDTPLIYVSTGHFGEDQFVPIDHNAVCKKYAYWEQIFAYQDNQENSRGLLCLEIDPRDPFEVVFVGTGNLWGWPKEGEQYEDYKGELIQVYYDGHTWASTTLYTAGEDAYSIIDLSTIIDPSFPPQDNRILIYAGLVKSSSLRSAASYYNEGTVVQYKYNNGYSASELYTPTNYTQQLPSVTWEKPPAAVSVKCYTRGNSPVLVALLQGDVEGGNPKRQSHVYKYTNNSWKKWYTPMMLNDNSMHLTDRKSLDIDQLHGYNIYVSAEGGIFKIQESLLANPLDGSQSWHWVSFNCIDPADSLHNLFAGIEDSIEAIHDQYGKRYRPNDSPPIDSVYTWNWMKAYGVRMLGADTLEAVGHPIPSDSAMTLYPECPEFRYNWIAYLPTDTMLCDYAFANTDCVLIVKNDQGEFWHTDAEDLPFAMVPGEGYQVGVSDTVVHQYPEPQQGQSFTGLESQLKGGGCCSCKKYLLYLFQY